MIFQILVEKIKVLWILGVLAFVGVAMAPLATGDGIAYLACKYNEPAGGVGGVLLGAGIIHVMPELFEIGLIAGATGGGLVVLVGVGVAV